MRSMTFPWRSLPITSNSAFGSLPITQCVLTRPWATLPHNSSSASSNLSERSPSVTNLLDEYKLLTSLGELCNILSDIDPTDRGNILEYSQSKTHGG